MEYLLTLGMKKNSWCITRMPNLTCFIGHMTQVQFRFPIDADNVTAMSRENLEIEGGVTYYILNPDGTLSETEQDLLQLFEFLGFEGSTQVSMSTLNVEEILTTYDMLM